MRYLWKCGLTVRDWRYVVRIANLDVSALAADPASSGADLIDLMTQALELVPQLSMGRPAFYCNRTVAGVLRRQVVTKVAGASLSMEEVAGRRVTAFDGIPVYRCQAIANDEALVA